MRLAAEISTLAHNISELEGLQQTSQAAGVHLQRAMEESKERVNALQQQKNSIRFPNWATDWKMEIPYPTLSHIRTAFPLGPTGQDVLNYLSGFDLGHNPECANPLAHVPPMVCMGKLWQTLQTLGVSTILPHFDWTPIILEDSPSGDGDDSEYQPTEEDDTGSN